MHKNKIQRNEPKSEEVGWTDDKKKMHEKPTRLFYELWIMTIYSFTQF